jgi:hypothetical protein
MPQRIIRRIATLFIFTIVSATISLAQSSTSTEVTTIPANSTSNSWQFAQSLGSSRHKLFVVTLDQPRRRQTCHVHSFTPDKLVCSRAIGGPRTYLPQQILAVILPGDDDVRLRLVLGFNAGLGVAIWGTVVLAAACPACAVATGVAAFFCFGAAGATLIGDGQPNRVLYLAPGQHLSAKLGYVQS